MTAKQLSHDDERIFKLLDQVKFGCYNPPHYAWFGVENGDDLIGVGAVLIKKGEAYLYCGVVDEAHRGRGIHQDVLNARLQYASEQGCEVAYVNVWSNNTYCKRSLEKAGFSPFKTANGMETWYRYVPRVCASVYANR